MVAPHTHAILSSELRSAYEAVTGNEPEFTSWGGWIDRDVRCVFDYILFRGPVFLPRSVLQLPASAEVVRFPERVPNALHPTGPLSCSSRIYCHASARTATSEEVADAVSVEKDLKTDTFVSMFTHQKLIFAHIHTRQHPFSNLTRAPRHTHAQTSTPQNTHADTYQHTYTYASTYSQRHARGHPR